MFIPSSCLAHEWAVLAITESKHIRAVKQPWRRSSKKSPLAQILRTNQRLDKLGAARSYFQHHGMLRGDALSDAIRSHPENGSNDSDSEEEEEEDLEFHDVEAVDGNAESDAAFSSVSVARKFGTCYSSGHS